MTGTEKKKHALVKTSNTNRLIKFQQYNESNNVVRFQEFHVRSRSNIPSTGIQENDTTLTDISLIQSFENPTDCKRESKKREQM